MALDPFLCTCCEPTPGVGVANPSSISSEISSDRAGGGKLLVIVYHPGRLACGAPRRPMGSFSCWGPGWSEALASPLHEWRPGRMGRKACHYTETRGGWGWGCDGGVGGGLLMHLAASPLQTSTGVTYTHLQKPQEERTAFQVEIPQRCAPEITPLIDPTMLTGGEGGEAISPPSAQLGRYHRWLQEMPCFYCRRPPTHTAPLPLPPSLTHTHISLAELSAVMTDLLCPSHPFALPPERNAAQRSIHTFHLCRSPSIVNNRR